MEILNNTTILKEKKPQGRQPKYTREFMMLIGKAVTDDGMRFREAAKAFGCSHGVISSAKKMYLTGEASVNFKKPDVTKEAELYKLKDLTARLKEQIGELYLENSMLKKAISYSRQIKKENSSVITSENLEQFQEDAN